MDQCMHCIVKGNLKACTQTKCPVHDTWYAQKLGSLLLGIVDAHYGASLHHLGDGDGLTKKEVDDIKCTVTNYK